AILIIVITVLCLVLAVLFMNVKASFLIAGYNTMSAAQRIQYDIVALPKFLGKIMFAISGSLLLLVLGVIFNSNSLLAISTILLFALSLLALIRTTTGSRIKEDDDSIYCGLLSALPSTICADSSCAPACWKHSAS